MSIPKLRRRERGEVAHHLGLGELRQARRRLARELVGDGAAPAGRASARRARGGPPATSRRSASRERLDEAVDVRDGAALGDGDEQRVVEARVVAAERVAGVDAALARRADRLGRACRPTRTANSLKVGRVRERRARGRAPRAAPCAYAASAMQVSPVSRSPCGPSSDRCTRPASASSVWFVVMFEVAFSRRMCCSRVCSVST